MWLLWETVEVHPEFWWGNRVEKTRRKTLSQVYIRISELLEYEMEK